ncbi:MAG: D-alanine--D-alanine ligase [Cytophagaceae bacterium]|nr:D-alanine--D-alanine ligase [Cytophagaceae bacterium]MDW8456100.1 D-alanine--D-alanine ligase [Cytophagaceae bacterium]
MKIGIFFGGQSKEREISFAGGRTVFDNLDKQIFTPVPIFTDSLGNFILINWTNIYKGTIRDFYPPAQYSISPSQRFQVYIESLINLPEHELQSIISSVGKKIQPEEFKNYIDFAFLAYHGPYGEDGSIQGLLEWYEIPYSGSGILPSAIGISKAVQHELMANAGFNRPNNIVLNKNDWYYAPDREQLQFRCFQEVGFPLVIKPSSQGSSIGVVVLKEKNPDSFFKAVNKAFFVQELSKEEWLQYDEEQKIQYIRKLSDIREGIGLPVVIHDQLIAHPDDLMNFLNQYFSSNTSALLIESAKGEQQIILESYIQGKEFSCIVIRNTNGMPLALPPTEIIKSDEYFDYRAKYLPGMSRKITPIDLPENTIQLIRLECERLFKTFAFNVYARIDGFVTSEGEVFLNDPNTTSGMLPSSFFFHQAAEIGLNPSRFLTYIIRTSLQERIQGGKNSYHVRKLLQQLDDKLTQQKNSPQQKIRVAVLMGGISTERHISVESGRNIYEKLSSSAVYEPIPIFVSGSEYEHTLFVIPISMMLKDNADDISDKAYHPRERHPVLVQIAEQAKEITATYTQQAIYDVRKISYDELASLCDFAFIALHGRPGEDGSVQAELEKRNIPYNGSGIATSQITINKYETNRILRENGISVANSMLVYKQEWEHFYFDLMHKIENHFSYPFIAKPADDGCSSAVKIIHNREELTAYAKMMFGWEGIRNTESSHLLKLKPNEEFPQKSFFMIEDIIRRDHARHFLEITGGLLTHYDSEGRIHYEMFEPSETLASGDVLTLEEKFLAGEGQNITPARFSNDPSERQHIAEQVKMTLKRVAEILHIEGYARIDAFVKIYDANNVEVVIIEVNSLPGMTPATCIFHQAALNGYTPYDFIDRIIQFGMQRKHKASS